MLAASGCRKRKNGPAGVVVEGERGVTEKVAREGLLNVTVSAYIPCSDHTRTNQEMNLNATYLFFPVNLHLNALSATFRSPFQPFLLLCNNQICITSTSSNCPPAYYPALAEADELRQAFISTIVLVVFSPSQGM